jgi:hypothetical protein
MKTIFYNNPINPVTVAMCSSADPLGDLMSLGVLSEDSAYLLLDSFDPVNNEDDAAIVVFLDCFGFDNAVSPTTLVIIPELLKQKYVEILRARRARVFEILDRIHITAISKSQTDIALAIENDKQRLRDITQTVNYKNIKTVRDLLGLIPAELLVDYVEKHQS